MTFFIEVPVRRVDGSVVPQAVNLAHVEMICHEKDGNARLCFADGRDGHLDVEMSFRDVMGLFPSTMQSGRCKDALLAYARANRD